MGGPGAGRIAGAAVALLGLILMFASGLALGPGLTALPEPLPGANLVASGPYRLVRHPMYLGVFLLFLGVSVFFTLSGYLITSLFLVEWENTGRIRLGASLDYDMETGSLASQSQLDTVEQHVNDARDKGATVLAGGKARPDLGPLFYEPTFLTDVKPPMLCFDQETFGPVVSIYKFETVDEAIERANDTRYGLNASVWTEDTRKGIDIARRIQSGTVNVNEAYAAAWASLDAPMGGFKDSGVGRRHGREGILKYTESQNVSVQHMMPIAPPKGVSYKQFAQVMTGALKAWKRVPFLR